MTYSGIQIESLAFHGPENEPAIVTFNTGLNVIYGASDTGKSFVVETIDFMLGAKGPLTDFKESSGYDRILLAISSGDESFTIARSMSGGAFEVFDGLFSDILPAGPGRVLGDVHSAKDTENLSAFLLEKIGLSNKRIKKNQKDETQNLSFRNLALHRQRGRDYPEALAAFGWKCCRRYRQHVCVQVVTNWARRLRFDSNFSKVAGRTKARSATGTARTASKRY